MATISTDSNDVLFCPFDDDTIDTILDLAPAADVTTLRADGTYRSGCVAVDDTGSNLVTNGGSESGFPQINSTYSEANLAATRSTDVVWEGSRSLKLQLDSGQQGGAYHMGSTTDATGFSANTTYMMSAYVFIPSGKSNAMTFKCAEYDGTGAPTGNGGTSSAFEVPFGKWTRCRWRHTTGTPLGGIDWYVQIADTEAHEQVVYLDGIQIEELGYETSYMETSRGTAGKLYWNTSSITGLTYEKGTLACWFYHRPYDATWYDNRWKTILTISNPAHDNDTINLAYTGLSGDDQYIRFAMFDSGGNIEQHNWVQVRDSTGDLVSEGWHHIAMTWDLTASPKVKTGYFDFAQVGTAEPTKYPSALASRLYVGSDRGMTNRIKTTFDDLRVSKTERTSTEIAAWGTWYSGSGPYRGPSRVIPSNAATLIGTAS